MSVAGSIEASGSEERRPASRRQSRVLIALLLLAGLPGLTTRAQGESFEFGELEGIVNLELSYGLMFRTAGRDSDLIAGVDGGDSLSANSDDGDLNYDKGITSNMLQASAEVAMRWRWLGAYARGVTFYDFESELADRARTPLSKGAQESVGFDADLREYFVNGQFVIGGMPVQIRVGDQILNWGESTFLRFGIPVSSPLDLVALLQPASDARDAQVPEGMVWAAVNLTTELAIEGYYQYDWQPVVVPPTGWFLSTSDVFGANGPNAAMLGAGQFSDLGTDLDAQLRLPKGTLGFDRDFMRIPGNGTREPSDQGQFGLTLQAIVPQLNSTKLALHFINYHSRLPVLNGRAASAAAVAKTSPAAVAARAATLAPIYESEGLPPAEAQAAAQAAAATLTVGEYAGAARLSADYREDIRMLGFSFNTTTITTGTLISGEVSHHFGIPLQILGADVFAAALSPIEFNPSFAEGPLGRFRPGEQVQGFIRRDKTQVELGIRQLLGPRLGAAQSILALDFGYVHVHDMPSKSRLRLSAPGITGPDDFADHLPGPDAWGYRIAAALTYDGILGGLTVTPRIAWVHDANGISPDSASSFVQGRKAIAAGVAVNYINTWLLEVDYTNFFGAGRFNLLNDRDFARIRMTYYR